MLRAMVRQGTPNTPVPGGKEKNASSRATSNRKQNAGMSNAEKAKMKDTADKVERIMATQVKIDRVLKQIRIDEVKDKITKLEKMLENYALKKDS